MPTSSSATPANIQLSPLQTAISACLALPVPYSELSAQIIRDLPVEQLHQLQRVHQALKDEQGALGAMLHAALVARYEEEARAELLDSAKESGTINLHDGALKVKVELKKTVEWDQDQLKQIAERIAAAGDDPAEYIDVRYAVPEKKYGAWPQAMRETFAPARTVKTAKSTITLVPGKGAA